MLAFPIGKNDSFGVAIFGKKGAGWKLRLDYHGRLKGAKIYGGSQFDLFAISHLSGES